MNGVNPQAYLRDVLARIVARHPMSSRQPPSAQGGLPRSSPGAYEDTLIASEVDIGRRWNALPGSSAFLSTCSSGGSRLLIISLIESLVPDAIAAQGIAVARHLAPFGGQPIHNAGIVH